jgi:hypothetical protein
MLVLTLAGAVLSACGPDATQARAHKSKATLDAELTHARIDLGLPESMLAPIEKDEQKVASGEGGLFYSYADAATNYSLLYNQLVGQEQTAMATLKTQAEADLQAFSAILLQRRSDGFSEATAYQARFDDAEQQYLAAQLPRDYAHVSDIAHAQTAALQAMWPAYQKLQTLRALVGTLTAAGISASQAQNFYDSDLEIFRNAATADHYTRLEYVIDGQMMQLVADQASVQPFVTAAMLQRLQASIDLLRQYGDTGNADKFQQLHDVDARQLASARHIADFLSVAQYLDNARNHRRCAEEGHTCTFQDADFRILSLTANLRAMLDNYKDKTGQDQPHQADFSLMRYYNVMSSHVVIISLREQTSRFYDNGKLVYWSYVTTGRPGHTSIPGITYATARKSPDLFLSPFPEGTPDYYDPTPIHWDVEYHVGGYFLHDAWWRHQFGPFTNLPHPDPSAFNGGSHGCINYPLQNMEWVYNFTQIGTPIIIY